jgi:hypothetical protein
VLLPVDRLRCTRLPKLATTRVAGARPSSAATLARAVPARLKALLPEARRIDYPQLTSDLWRQLGDYFRADVAALGELLERDLGHWLVEREQRAGRPATALAQSSSGTNAA